MSKHHHHPHEGHSGGEAPGMGRKPLHHSVFFWVAGLFILVALVCFIMEGSGGLRTGAPAVPASATSGAGK